MNENGEAIIMRARTSKERAMRALCDLMGGGEATTISGGPGSPFGLRLADRPLILIAGDQSEPLDHTKLRTFAVKEGCREDWCLPTKAYA